MLGCRFVSNNFRGLSWMSKLSIYTGPFVALERHNISAGWFIPLMLDIYLRLGWITLWNYQSLLFDCWGGLNSKLRIVVYLEGNFYRLQLYVCYPTIACDLSRLIWITAPAKIFVFPYFLLPRKITYWSHMIAPDSSPERNLFSCLFNEVRITRYLN